MDKELKRSIIVDNYQNAWNRCIPQDVDGYIKINSNSVSCIDNIDIYVKIDNGIISDVKFYGEACVIAVASSNILSKLLVGKSINDANLIIDNYNNMVNEKEYDKDLLGEAEVFDDIYLQPARKSCATIFVKGFNKIIDDYKE